MSAERPSTDSPSGESPVVIFDGVCNFCSATVRIILKNDRHGRIRFAPLQSPAGGELFRRHGIDPVKADTFLFIEGGRALTRTDASLAIARHLRFPWNLYRLVAVLPRGLRNAAYDLIARNRYRWFGKRSTCFVPTPEERSRFLDPASE
jgi:predicted DCC family thiol-disulfide oxidoreductase YuxK